MFNVSEKERYRLSLQIIRLTAPCPRLTAVVNALINTSSEYAKLVKDNQDFLDYIQLQIGVDFSDLFLYTTVLDPLYCEVSLLCRKHEICGNYNT